MDVGSFESTYWLLRQLAKLKQSIKTSWSDVLCVALLAPFREATFTVLCTLSVSPEQHPEVSAGTLAEAGGTEAADPGGCLQDRSFCEGWGEWSEDWRGHPTLGGDDAQSLAALLRSLSTEVKEWKLLGPREPNLPRFYPKAEPFLSRVGPRARAFAVPCPWWVWLCHRNISYLSLWSTDAVFACWGRGRLEVPTKQAVCNSLFKGPVIGSGI